MREKAEKYKSWGVPRVWLVDRHAKRLYMCHKGLIDIPDSESSRCQSAFSISTRRLELLVEQYAVQFKPRLPAKMPLAGGFRL